jgi:hypothetical protein
MIGTEKKGEPNVLHFKPDTGNWIWFKIPINDSLQSASLITAVLY